jgi:chromate transporter
VERTRGEEAAPAPPALGSDDRGRLGLFELFVVFVKAGLAFGGGLGILAVLEDELVKKRRTLSPEEFLAVYGIGRVIPSGTMTALTIAYGSRFAGLLGTVVALTGMVLPAFVLTVLLTAGYGYLREGALFEVLPITILPAALAFILVAALRLGKHVFRPGFDLILAAAAFVGSYAVGLNTALLLVAGGLAGLLFFRGDRRA